MPSKKAVLIGCNYPRTNAELMGCINDVFSVKDMLLECYGFTESDIEVLIDTDSSYTQPTGRNIKAALNKMVAAARDGDELVVHFSGHGTQVPSDDPEESDSKDEAICPCDMNLIEDGDLRIIFKPLGEKGTVKLTFIADCCHSGTLLDHNNVIISGPKPGGPPPPAIDTQAIQNMLAALGGRDMPMKNRALPFNDLCGMLNSMLSKMGGDAAGTKAGQGNMAESMTKLFGKDAPAKSLGWKEYMAAGKAAYEMYQVASGKKKADASSKNAQGVLMSFFSGCMGGGSSAAPGGGMAGMADAASDGGAAPQSEAIKPPAAGMKPPKHDQLNDDIGILITGCQSSETSADARPPGGKAHGALSNALVTVSRQHHDANRDYPLTCYNLVVGVRDMLAKTGFHQNPCLECSEKWADSAFVAHA